jgi:hypothetical protein
MGGVETAPSIREIKVAQSRAEALLLELVQERLMQHKPPSKEDYEKDDKEAAERGYPISETEKAHRTGYDLGWWDAIEQLHNIIDNINEANQYRVVK